jgi:hypothetical protein
LKNETPIKNKNPGLENPGIFHAFGGSGGLLDDWIFGLLEGNFFWYPPFFKMSGGLVFFDFIYKWL